MSHKIPGDGKAGHLVRSHAHEEDIPGTVNLKAAEGDDTAYGQALYPAPALDPNDPLQWPRWKKSTILVVCSLYSFLATTALLGPSVYIGIFSVEFGITPNDAAGLINYSNLAFGFGSLIFVPLYHKFGRRPVMLGSLVLYCAGLLGCSQSETFTGLMFCRVLQGFASSVCEALPVQLVNDIFFLHERGKRLGYYTVCLCLGATGPLYAGYMLAGGYSWRLFFYVELAFAVALLVATFFVVEETNYDRKRANERVTERAGATSTSQTEKATADVDESASLDGIPPRKSFVQTLKFWGVWNRETDFFMMMARSFTYFLVPHVFWVVTTYGIYIGLGALTFNIIFPIKIVAPPYSWPETSSGLLAVATIVGYAFAFIFTSSSDRLAARLTRRNDGIREAEMRLGVMLPAMVIAPAGLALFGVAAELDLHWVAYFFGSGLCQFGGYFYFTFTLAYAIDSYQSNISEMLIAMNIGKQAISFGMGINLIEWVRERGYAVMIAGVFMSLLLVNNLALLIFMFWGKRIRAFMARTWLAAVHRDSIKEVATH